MNNAAPNFARGGPGGGSGGGSSGVAVLTKVCRRVPDPALTAAVVVAAALVVALLSKCGGDSWKQYDARFASRVENLLKDSARLQATSAQDGSAFLAYIHANRAMTQIQLCRSLASDSDIQRITGIDIVEFNRRAAQVEKKALSRLVDACPSIVPEGSGLGSGSWI